MLKQSFCYLLHRDAMFAYLIGLSGNCISSRDCVIVVHLPICIFRLFFVIEYIGGGDLMFHMQRQRRLPEDHARYFNS